MKSPEVGIDIIRKYFSRDVFAESCGIEITEAAEGSATAVVKVEERHLNGIGLVHGGLIFTLADMAIAAAAHTRGKVAVSVNSTITYIKAARGTSLRAEAREVSRNPRLAAYTADITDETGRVVATAQGLAYVKNENIA